MAKKSKQAKLPGTIYLNKNRYWWKVQLPGESKTKARSLKPVGAKYATKDIGVAREVAANMLHQAMYKENHKEVDPADRTVMAIITAYSQYAREYYQDAHGTDYCFSPAESEEMRNDIDKNSILDSPIGSQGDVYIYGTDFAIDGVPVGLGPYNQAGIFTGILENGDLLDNRISFSGYNKVVLVPEPATLILLTVGALYIRKRKSTC